VRRTLEDLYELTRQLHDRFHGAPIYLVAHSWGTYLGLQAVHEHPELYRGYVGMGQMTGDTLREHVEQRRCVLAEVAANPDTVLRERIRARYGATATHVTEGDLFATRTELRRATSVWPIIRTGLRAPEYSLLDGFRLQKGAQFVGQHMRYDMSDEWMRTSPAIEVPVAFFLGRHDCNTPSSLAAEFLNRIDAPLKRLVWFDSSAHFPFWEEPRRFTTAMVEFDSLVSAR
jgi:pimeloyl-ACP methyl ester carboxylesterase